MATPGMPEQPAGAWFWLPIIRDPETTAELAAIRKKLEQLVTTQGETMALVKVESAQLEALDSALDEVATSLADKIAALALPDADLQPLLDDVAALRALAAPTPAAEPSSEPASEPVFDENV